MSTFRIGDRVRCVSVYKDSARVLNCEGTVCYVPDNENTSGYGVSWDENGSHDCSGYCPEGTGWYVRVQALQLVEPEVVPNLEIGGLL